MNPEQEPKVPEDKLARTDDSESTGNSPENEQVDIQALADIRHQAYKRNSIGTHEAIYNFVQNLRNENPDIEPKKYQLYHLIIGSSVPDDILPSMELDLPGKIFENFIREDLANIAAENS